MDRGMSRYILNQIRSLPVCLEVTEVIRIASYRKIGLVGGSYNCAGGFNVADTATMPMLRNTWLLTFSLLIDLGIGEYKPRRRIRS
jgi:hypothetical protein